MRKPTLGKVPIGVIAALISVIAAVMADAFLGTTPRSAGNPQKAQHKDAPTDKAAEDEKGELLSKLTANAALIGVIAAVIAGWFYGVGTIAHLSYFNGMGFDGHLFPALGSELQMSGFLYVLR